MKKDVDFIHLNLEPLVLSIQSNAKNWVKSIGKLLNEAAKESLMALKAELEVRIKLNLVNSFTTQNFIRVDSIT